MFSHIVIGADDIDKARVFYDATIGALGGGPGATDPKGRLFYHLGEVSFVITRPVNGRAASAANGGTIGFRASSPEEADAWHAAGVAAGGTSCEDPPGIREVGNGVKLYLAYLRDPTGNKICVAYRVVMSAA